MRYSLILGFVFLLSALPVGAQDRLVPASRAEVQLSYAPIVQRAAPAVVNIYTKKVVSSRQSALFEHPLFRRFFGEGRGFGAPRERVQGSLGSGVIVRASGVVVTNNHVIEGADEITVVLSDRRELDAKVILADPRTDLAVLSVDAGGENLPALTLSDSDEVLVGDLVLAIGNPFGIGQTVTSGIVSATARTRVGISDFGFFIQTDAAVNPGNSGGALVGLNGDLLGINTAIYSRSGGSNGIGFAVPANMVRSVLRAALSEGDLVRPWLGIKGQTVNSELAGGLGLDRAGGVLIDAVYRGGPADRAGIDIGDVILAIDGKEIIDEGGLNFRIATREDGDLAKLVVLRRGRLEELDVELALPPANPAPAARMLDGRHPLQGVTVANMSPRFNEEIGLDPFDVGVVVTEVSARSPAARYQFVAPGDVILTVNGNAVGTVADLEASLEGNDGRLLYDYRRGRAIYRCEIIGNRSFRCSQLR